jgi:hypothetical protein
MAHRVYLGDQGGRSYTLPDKCLPANFNPATAYQSAFARRFIGDQTSNVIRQMLGDAGAYFIGQLEALDQRMAMPITAVTYSRDIERRPDIGPYNELASFTRLKFAAAQSDRDDIDFDSDVTTEFQQVNVEQEKITTPIFAKTMKTRWTLAEIEKAALAGMPLETQAFEALNTDNQLKIDRLHYMGSQKYGFGGLLNHGSVLNVSPVAAGAGGTPNFEAKTPEEILADVNEILRSVWTATGLAIMPNRILVSQRIMSALSIPIAPLSGVSILKYLQDNAICKIIDGKDLEIVPVKWASGAGAAGTDRMAAYVPGLDNLASIFSPMQQYGAMEVRDVAFHQHYRFAFGGLQLRYPEKMAYRDGL